MALYGKSHKEKNKISSLGTYWNKLPTIGPNGA